MALREADSMNHLRLLQKMEPSTCNAVLKNGEKVEVFMYRGKPAIEVGEQFYFADSYPEFAKYELKPPVVAPIPEAPVQEVDNWVDRSEPADTSGSKLRLQLARNPDVVYKRNIIRQTFGNLEVKEFLGVGQSDSTTRYWSAKCKLTGKYVSATQAQLVCGVVTCCKNAKTPTETIVHRGAQLA
jgi:hypothetical protein